MHGKPLSRRRGIPKDLAVYMTRFLLLLRCCFYSDFGDANGSCNPFNANISTRTQECVYITHGNFHNIVEIIIIHDIEDDTFENFGNISKRQEVKIVCRQDESALTESLVARNNKILENLKFTGSRRRHQPRSRRRYVTMAFLGKAFRQKRVEYRTRRVVAPSNWAGARHIRTTGQVVSFFAAVCVHDRETGNVDYSALKPRPVAEPDSLAAFVSCKDDCPFSMMDVVSLLRLLSAARDHCEPMRFSNSAGFAGEWCAERTRQLIMQKAT
ncbi:hypothetical protein EVAR_49042_1 [Eumeta japonica]|uniref:Uncharacterized protein n=1 Tax=Eumeta variegata TaxID=151549 RepID=A0A4C1XQI1_EUMVA|nr:hypothetical protein EVAR_49042_1 [Eumeta japonica]